MMDPTMMLLPVVLMFACASCEDTLVKGVDISSGLTYQEGAMRFQKRKNDEGIEEGEYGNTLNSEMMNKMEKMEKTIISLEKKISMVNQNNAGFIYNEPDIDQMIEDIKQNSIDITALRTDVDINEDASNTKIANLESKFDEKIQKLDDKIEKLESNLVSNITGISTFLASTLHPIGSIIAWYGPSKTGSELPAGWQRCDGSVIRSPSVLHGQKTPDLNNKQRFLRGGPDSEAGTVQEDAVQEHQHVDVGHNHTDSGHYHLDKGHSHKQDHTGNNINAWVGTDDCSKKDTRLVHGDLGWCMIRNWDTYHAKADIETSKADISHVSAGLKGVVGAKTSTETRPTNMKVVYIMRIK